ALGLVGSSLRLMLNKVFYSFQDTKTPMINGAIAVAVNIILNLLLIKPMAHNGLALATSISATVTTILLIIDLRKSIGPIGMKKISVTFIKSSFAAAIMGIVVYLLYYKLGGLLAPKKIIDLLMLIISVGVGALVYLIVAILIKIQDFNQIFILKNKLK